MMRAPSLSRRIEEIAVALRPCLPVIHVGMALAFVVLIGAPVLLPASKAAHGMGVHGSGAAAALVPCVAGVAIIIAA